MRRSEPRLETDGVGRKDRQASTGQGGPERLQRVTCQAGHLALTDGPLTVVLMKDQHVALGRTALRLEQEGLDCVAIRSRVAQETSRVSAGRLAADDGHGRRIRHLMKPDEFSNALSERIRQCQLSLTTSAQLPS